MNRQAEPKALLGWMQCLADPTRLRALRLLERQELSVAELCAVLQMPQSTVSRHLKLLGDQGWTRSQRSGTTNRYRLTLEGLGLGAKRLWGLTRAQTDGWAAVEQDGLRLDRVLARRQDSARAFFAGAAGRWDSLRLELYGRGINQAAVMGLLSREAVVADLGCGTGLLALELSRHVKQVIGVDQSATMLQAARRHAGGQANLDLRRGELEALPIDAGTCDAALMLLVLTYVSDPAAALGEAARILKPGGRLVVVDLLRHDREEFRREMGQQCLGFETRKLEEMLAAAGLARPHAQALDPDPQAKGPALLLAGAMRPG